MKKQLFLAAIMLMTCASAMAQDEATAKCGETVKLVATPQPGYKFVQWSDGSTKDTLVLTINGDMDLISTYTATFAKASYTVSGKASVAEMGSVTGGKTAEFGEEVTLTAEPSSKCYQFKCWADDPSNTTPVRTVIVGAENNEYTAIFEEASFKVQISSGNEAWGSVSFAAVE